MSELEEKINLNKDLKGENNISIHSLTEQEKDSEHRYSVERFCKRVLKKDSEMTVLTISDGSDRPHSFIILLLFLVSSSFCSGVS